MDEPVDTDPADSGSNASAFISYAAADRKQALAICSALERRGTRCWISCRDVPPGENYQEAIVCALRAAKALILIFSGAANNSDEIKKELSLASRYRVPVMALRIEDVEPSDAFAYELSTRQWIDAFEGLDSSLDVLAQRVAGVSTLPSGTAHPSASFTRSGKRPARRMLLGVGAALFLLLSIATFWVLRQPSADGAHVMAVRLSGFRLLSNDFPSNTADLVSEEIIAAFGEDGVIRISTAAMPQNSTDPAYLLGGTIRRNGDQIRVITRLINERSGATLWTDSFDYEGEDVAKVPRRIAVDAGNMVHCGLFAASTHHKPLPDPVMSNYMQFCQNSWWSQSFSNPEKALDAARKVAAAAPDFSWGWSAITTAAQLVFYRTAPGPDREAIRRLGIEAADKALELDPKNSEALAQKSLLIGRLKWSEQESLLTKAIAAQPLFCGCEYFLYGVMLNNVGLYSTSVEKMRRSTEMLALDGISQLGLADALVATGKADAAVPHFKAAIDLFRDPGTDSYLSVKYAPETGDYAAGVKALADPEVRMSKPKRAAIQAGFRAMQRSDTGARKRAAQRLIALPQSDADSLVARLLGALGSSGEALRIVERRAVAEGFDAAAWLWYPSMRGALHDPAFPGLAERLGLMKYWRQTNRKPDACYRKDAAPFCRRI